MPTEGPGILFTILVFLPALSFLVFFHELGHFWVARRFGIRVEKFSIGFGKAVWQRTDKHGTRWQIAVIPLGGYVQFFGDGGVASNPGEDSDGMTEKERSVSYHHKPVWQRSLVAAAGPAANFLLALVIYAGLLFTYGESYRSAVVGGVQIDSAADKAGLQIGDRISSIDGVAITRFQDVGMIVMLEAGRAVDIEIVRGGRILNKSVVIGSDEIIDRFGNKHYRGLLGVQSGAIERREYGPIGAIGAGAKRIQADLRMMVTTIGQIVMGYRSLSEMGGPVRMASVVGEVAQLGFVPLLGLIALISVNLGFVNLLPIPALDGGHLAIYAVEAVKGSALNGKAVQWVYGAGAMFVLSLMAFLIINDIYLMTGSMITGD